MTVPAYAPPLGTHPPTAPMVHELATDLRFELVEEASALAVPWAPSAMPTCGPCIHHAGAAPFPRLCLTLDPESLCVTGRFLRASRVLHTMRKNSLVLFHGNDFLAEGHDSSMDKLDEVFPKTRGRGGRGFVDGRCLGSVAIHCHGQDGCGVGHDRS